MNDNFKKENIKDILKELPVINNIKFDGISPVDIIFETCLCYDIPFKNIRNDSKKRKYVEPRQLIAYFIKKHSKKEKVGYNGVKKNIPITLQEIAIIVNKKNHGTIIHAIREIGNQISSNKLFKNKIKELETKIKDNETF